MKKLPNKLSSLIDVALNDLVLAEKSKDYNVDMDVFHIPRGDNTCSVCLAGQVMAFSLKAKKGAHVDPDEMGENTNHLYAIDNLRLGFVGDAADQLNLETNDGPFVTDYFYFDREIPDYELDRAGFKSAMKKLSKDLKAYGL